jgi:nucleoside-diphosphate-sugar epimerase
MDRVLVTGGTGYIARWCIAQLMEQGYPVRTTVREAAAEHDVRAAIAEAGVDGDLSFEVADLCDDGGWEAAVSGCRYVIHPASPFGRSGSSDIAAMVAGARGGSLRVLAASMAAGVERVVVTSAANTSSPTAYTTPGITDETLWTDETVPGLDAYRVSKTIAEKACWAAIAESNGETTLTTVLPGAVLGPVLGSDRFGSVEVIGRLLRGEQDWLPRIALEVVDVRDVAALHLLTMTSEEAAGERFLATGQLILIPEIATILRDELGEAGARIPTRYLSDAEVEELATTRAEVQAIVPGLGRQHRHTTAKAERMFGWKPRSARDVVVDCARSLIAHGAT